MIVTVRWVAALLAAFLTYLVILTIFVAASAAFGGNAQSVYMFGMSFAIFLAILAGTAIVPLQHRKIALWMFIVLMCLIPLISVVMNFVGDAGVASAPWLDIAGTFGGVIFAPFFARSTIKGCDPKVTYPLSVPHPWLKNLSR
jgi:hypothetical protein